MASVHKKEGSKIWHAAFTLPDGRRTFRSTGATDRKTALRVAREFEEASRKARAGRLTEQRARTTIADIYSIANGDPLPSDTLQQFCKRYLASREPEISSSSYEQYTTTCKALCEHLAPDKALDAVTRREAEGMRNKLLKRLSAGSVQKYIKISRMIWNAAIQEGAAHKNVWKGITVKKTGSNGRRALTENELLRILAACSDEWRGAVLFGYYTGQRLRDICNLTWRQIDIEKNNEVHFVTMKTGKILHIPLHKSLVRYVMDLPTSDNPDGALFPSLHGKTSGTLSRQFNEVLQDAGLAVKKSHHTKGAGRAAARDMSGLSFHCLRHTATSGLKNAGVSDVIARSIIGHDSEAISDVYTHIEGETMRQAVDLLPDLEAKA